ncbi:hypothetical protein [Prescottella agglutinans]|uniref:hypothetical protein n=1 Tax=Prescottella agglutinans TaxID=1644129 RepID=UPI003D966680
MSGQMQVSDTIEPVGDQPRFARTVVTVWLYGGPHHGDSKDVSVPLPPTITTSANEVYARVGPELDESGQPLSAWCYRWEPHVALEAPLDR